MSRNTVAALLGLLFFLSFSASVAYATELTGADSQCKAATPDKCGCGQVVDPKTGQCTKGSNQYQCICSQPDPGGGTTFGTCTAASVCTATGQPGTPSGQQLSNATNGNSANGTDSGSTGASTGSSGSSGSGSTGPSVESTAQSYLSGGSSDSGSGSGASGSETSGSGQNSATLPGFTITANPSNSPLPTNQSILDDILSPTPIAQQSTVPSNANPTAPFETSPDLTGLYGSTVVSGLPSPTVQTVPESEQPSNSLSPTQQYPTASFGQPTGAAEACGLLCSTGNAVTAALDYIGDSIFPPATAAEPPPVQASPPLTPADEPSGIPPGATSVALPEINICASGDCVENGASPEAAPGVGGASPTAPSNELPGSASTLPGPQPTQAGEQGTGDENTPPQQQANGNGTPSGGTDQTTETGTPEGNPNGVTGGTPNGNAQGSNSGAPGGNPNAGTSGTGNTGNNSNPNSGTPVTGQTAGTNSGGLPSGVPDGITDLGSFFGSLISSLIPGLGSGGQAPSLVQLPPIQAVPPQSQAPASVQPPPTQTKSALPAGQPTGTGNPTGVTAPSNGVSPTNVAGNSSPTVTGGGSTNQAGSEPSPNANGSPQGTKITNIIASLTGGSGLGRDTTQSSGSDLPLLDFPTQSEPDNLLSPTPTTEQTQPTQPTSPATPPQQVPTPQPTQVSSAPQGQGPTVSPNYVSSNPTPQPQNNFAQRALDAVSSFFITPANAGQLPPGAGQAAQNDLRTIQNARARLVRAFQGAALTAQQAMNIARPAKEAAQRIATLGAHTFSDETAALQQTLNEGAAYDRSMSPGTLQRDILSYQRVALYYFDQAAVPAENLARQIIAIAPHAPPAKPNPGVNVGPSGTAAPPVKSTGGQSTGNPTPPPANPTPIPTPPPQTPPSAQTPPAATPVPAPTPAPMPTPTPSVPPVQKAAQNIPGRYNPASGQAIADATNIACAAVGCANPHVVQQAMGGVCSIESGGCNSYISHNGSQYQGLFQNNRSEAAQAIQTWQQISQSPKLTADQQAGARTIAQAIQNNPNPRDPIIGAYIGVGYQIRNGILGRISSVTNDPNLAAGYAELGQIAPDSFNNFSPGKLVSPVSATNLTNNGYWVRYGYTVAQAAATIASISSGKVASGTSWEGQFTPNGTPATSAPCNYQGCSATPSIKPGNPGYAEGISRVASCPPTGMCYYDPQTGAYGVPSNPNMTQQQFVQAAREDDAIERLVQAGTITAQLASTYAFQDFKATLTAPASATVRQTQLASELVAGTGISQSQAQQLAASNPTAVLAAINAISTGSGVQPALAALGLASNTPTNQQALQNAMAADNNLSTTGAQTQFTYTITDQSGTVIANNVPLPQGAVGSDGTVRLLANVAGQPLGPDGTTPLANGTTPLLVSSDSTLPTPTPSSTNPDQEDFPDNRPAPPPQPPYTPSPYTPTPSPTGQPASIAQPSQPGYAQPPQQVPPPQPIPQPLPQPAISPTSATSSSATSTPAAVTIIADPNSVQSGGISFIVWSSVGTASCQVSSQNAQLLGMTTRGSALSQALSTTTVFTAACQTFASTTVSASTTVTVPQ